MRLITREELDKYIDFIDLYNDTIDGYKKFSKGETITPKFTVFEIPSNNGSVHFKYGYIIGSETFSFKYSGVFYENEKIGLSNFLGLFVVFNSNTGEVELIIDDKGYLTDYRTGVAGAIATKTLANPNSKTVSVLGCGIQARMQIHSLLKVMPSIKTLKVYGRNKDKLEQYSNEMKKTYPQLEVLMYYNVEDCVKDTDIIYTVTYSEKPILNYEWLNKGVHITAVGACGESMQELDENIIKHANLVVVDSIEATSTHGELHHAIDKEFDANESKELGTILNSEYKRNSDDITVCDLVGIGFQDAVIGNSVYKKVKKIGDK